MILKKSLIFTNQVKDKRSESKSTNSYITVLKVPESPVLLILHDKWSWYNQTKHILEFRYPDKYL